MIGMLFGLALVLTVACGELSGTSSFGSGSSNRALKHDSEIKEIAAHTIGHEPSDGQIRSACAALKAHGWDYYAAGMTTALDGSKTAIMASITTVAGGGTQSYCEAKLR